MRYLPDGEHRHRFLAAVRATGLSLEELWLRYFGLGGDAGKIEIDAYLSGLAPLSSLQHDLLAHAINERLDEIAPPARPLRRGTPPGTRIPPRLRPNTNSTPVTDRMPHPGPTPPATDRTRTGKGQMRRIRGRGWHFGQL